MPVTQEVASSSLVGPAILFNQLGSAPFCESGDCSQFCAALTTISAGHVEKCHYLSLLAAASQRVEPLASGMRSLTHTRHIVVHTDCSVCLTAPAICLSVRTFDSAGPLITKFDGSEWAWGEDSPEREQPGAIVFEDARGRKAAVLLEISR